MEKSSAKFDEREHVEVTLIPGISHGFVQFVSVFPEGWKHIERCAKWIGDIFQRPPHSFEGPAIEMRLRHASIHQLHGSGSDLEMPTTGRHHQRTGTAGSDGGATSEGDEDAPLVMTRMNGSAEKKKKKQVQSPKEERGRYSSKSPKRQRSKSIQSLPSEEDLLKRRMQQLTFSMMGSKN